MKRGKKSILFIIILVLFVVTFLIDKCEVRAESNDIQNVDLGYGHSAVIKEDGTLWVWGVNSYGQVGDATTDNKNVPVNILDHVQTIKLENFLTAAIKEDGSLWMWGNNNDGQIGNGTEENQSVPNKILENVKDAELNYSYSAAIKEDESLWMWGDNFYGQIGDGTNTNQTLPVKIMDNVKKVSLGSGHSAAIKKDGSLWMWGSNNNGELGDGTTTNKNQPVKVMEGVKDILLSYDFSAAIKEDGSLWMWGKNSCGQLGNGTSGTGKKEKKPVQILSDVKEVRLGSCFSAAIKEDGSLWMWGDNQNGQVGDGATALYVKTPLHVMNSVSNICLSANNSAAIKEDGSLWTWGENSYGQIGDGTKINKYSPVEVLKDVKSVSINGVITAAIKEDGSLWMWGDNSNGQLGNNTNENVRIPQKISVPFTGDLPGKVENLQGNSEIGQAGTQRELKLKWDSVESADGYELEYSENEDFSDKTSVNIDDGNITEYAGADPQKRGITVYVRIRAYKISSGKKNYGEWSDILTQKIGNQILPDEMLGIKNGSITIPYSYYKKLWGEEQAKRLFDVFDMDSNGICYGLVHTGILASTYDYPEISSYGVDSLYKLDSWKKLDNAYSSPLMMSALDMVRYTHLLQFSDFEKEEKKYGFYNIDAQKKELNLEGLYNGVKSCQEGEENPISISIGNDGILGGSHALVAVCIQEETDEQVSIGVYDCNYPGELKTLKLLKENGKFTGWKYSAGLMNWHGDLKIQPNVYLIYYGLKSDLASIYQSEQVILNALKNDFVKAPLAMEKELLGKDEQTLLYIYYGGYEDYKSLEERWNLDEPLTMSEAPEEPNTQADTGKLYWLKEGAATFKDVPAGVKIALSSPYHSIEVTTSEQSDITFSVQDEKVNSVDIFPEKDASYEITYSDSKFDTGECTKIVWKGECTEASNVSFKQQNEIIKMSGTKKLFCETLQGTRENERGEFVDSSKAVIETKELDDSCVYQFENKEDSIIIRSSSDQDGVYDETVAVSDKCIHKYETITIKRETCTEEGQSCEKCRLCGSVKPCSEKTISSEGHKFGAWKESSSATVFSPSIQKHICNVCKVVETKEVGNKLSPKLSVNASSIPLKVKQSTTKLEVNGLAKGDYITAWKSSNTKIVKVNNNGKITALKKTGKATVTIMLASGLKKNITIKVQKNIVKTKKISNIPTKLVLVKGSKKSLSPVITPITSQEKVKYQSSNKKIVSISSKGVITAKKPGTAKITVKSGSKKTIITVKVSK